ncbi:50S ribosomal protein L29 [archaeon]|nr:50S ribosomal protein L29 [archaeon]
MIIKKSELKEMSLDKINEKIIELRKELMNARAKSASGVAPDNPGKVKEIKRTIARMLTIKKMRGNKK